VRYKSGSIAISEASDLPILLHVRNARCIAREQLYALLNFDGSPLARRRLAWRVDRLVQAQYLDALEQRIRGEKVYTIARKGLLYLEMAGFGLVSIHSSMEILFDPSTVTHWIDLMDIRVRLARDAVLEAWTSEVEVSSENMETGAQYAKDYDAIAALQIAGKSLRFGIEYERTTKARERYRQLRQTLVQEKILHGVLYFIRDGGRLFSVANELANAHPALFFCSLDGFRARGLEALFFRSTIEPGASLPDLLGLQYAASLIGKDKSL
jgi:hypothetical protein